MSNCNTQSIEMLKKKLATNAVRSAELPLTQNLEGTETIPIIKNNEDMQVSIATLLKNAESSFFSVEEPMTFSQAISTVSINRRKIGMIVSYRETIKDSFELMQYHGNVLDTSEYRKPSNWKQIKTPQTKFAGFFSSKEELEANANASLFTEAVVGTSPNNYELYYLAKCGNWKSKGLLSNIPDSKLSSTPVKVADIIGEYTVSDRAVSDHLGRNIHNTYVDKCTFKTIVSEELSKLLPENIHKLFEDSKCCNPPTVEVDLEQLTQALLTKFRLDNDGFLYIGDTKLEPSLKGPEGAKGDPGDAGRGINGRDGVNGTNGRDGKTPEFRVVNNKLQTKYTDEPDTQWRDLYDFNTNNNNTPPTPITPTKPKITYIYDHANVELLSPTTEVNEGGSITVRFKITGVSTILKNVEVNNEVLESNTVYTEADGTYAFEVINITKDTVINIKTTSTHDGNGGDFEVGKGSIALSNNIALDDAQRISDTELNIINKCYIDGTGGSFTVEVPVDTTRELIHSYELDSLVPSGAITIEILNNGEMARITFICSILKGLQGGLIKLKDQFNRFISIFLGEPKTPDSPPVTPSPIHHNLTIKYEGAEPAIPNRVERIPAGNNGYVITIPEGYSLNGEVRKESGDVVISGLNLTVNNDSTVVVPLRKTQVTPTPNRVVVDIDTDDLTVSHSTAKETLDDIIDNTTDLIPETEYEVGKTFTLNFTPTDRNTASFVKVEVRVGGELVHTQTEPNLTWVVRDGGINMIHPYYELPSSGEDDSTEETITVTISSNNETMGTVEFVDSLITEI